MRALWRRGREGPFVPNGRKLKELSTERPRGGKSEMMMRLVLKGIAIFKLSEEPLRGTSLVCHCGLAENLALKRRHSKSQSKRLVRRLRKRTFWKVYHNFYCVFFSLRRNLHKELSFFNFNERWSSHFSPGRLRYQEDEIWLFMKRQRDFALKLYSSLNNDTTSLAPEK